MNRKAILEFKTTCPFPLLEYEVALAYHEVKKPSGFSYILLELVNASGAVREPIVTVLKRYGIPADLHYIFAEELATLVATDILAVNINHEMIREVKYLEQLTFSEFRFTEKGRLMFEKGAIPTGALKEKTQRIYYSPVTRKYALRYDKTYPIASSFLGESFLDRVDCDVSGIAEYLEAEKARIGLKAEEMIVKITEGEPTHLAIRPEENMKIALHADGAEIFFDTTDETAFFSQYYTAELLSRGMKEKKKYKFEQDVPTVAWGDVAVKAFHLPYAAAEQAKTRCALFLNRGRHGYVGGNGATVCPQAEKHLELLDPRAEFALLDSAGCRYFIPANVKLPCKTLGGELELQLLMEVAATEEQFKGLLRAICADCYGRGRSEENSEILLYLATAMADITVLSGYMEKEIGACAEEEEKAKAALALHAVFKRAKGWEATFERVARELLDRCVGTLTSDGVAYKNAFLLPLWRETGLPMAEYVASFAEGMKANGESDERVYLSLAEAGLPEDDALAVTDAVARYANCVLARAPMTDETELARHFSLLSVNMWRLCDMLGVKDPSAYTLQENYNIDDFFDAFSTYDKARKEVERYRRYAEDVYRRLSRFADVIDPVQEVLAIERSASEHPERITRKFIDGELARGRYSIAVSNLLIKAQYDLRARLAVPTTTQANELINMAETQGIITPTEADQLHKLRILRNRIQHPENGGVRYDKALIEGWRDVVFSLNGGGQ